MNYFLRISLLSFFLTTETLAIPRAQVAGRAEWFNLDNKTVAECYKKIESIALAGYRPETDRYLRNKGASYDSNNNNVFLYHSSTIVSSILCAEISGKTVVFLSVTKNYPGLSEVRQVNPYFDALKAEILK